MKLLVIASLTLLISGCGAHGKVAREGLGPCLQEVGQREVSVSVTDGDDYVKVDCKVGEYVDTSIK